MNPRFLDDWFRTLERRKICLVLAYLARFPPGDMRTLTSAKLIRQFSSNYQVATTVVIHIRALVYNGIYDGQIFPGNRHCFRAQGTPCARSCTGPPSARSAGYLRECLLGRTCDALSDVDLIRRGHFNGVSRPRHRILPRRSERRVT